MTVRTRMAPSPTGEYHIGHIRTVLYNYAFTKKTGGNFLLRIEDTDRNRYVEGAVDRILDVIEEYGLSWDEGPRKGGYLGPYVQSERLDIYRDRAEELVQKGAAYHCFCTTERLAELRKEQQDQKLPVTKYDKKCATLSPDEVAKRLADGEKSVIRLNVPKNKDITFTDIVYGEITINTDALDDQVLLKSDGYPSYHLAVVIDDHMMEITHVMRGNDWVPSTPKHVLLYEAFGWDLPEYVHLPNLKELGSSKKLSKRSGAFYAVDFLELGYLPEAVVNFVMFLGWNPGTEKEIYSIKEFIEDFDINRIHKTDLVAFDRDKLLWMNGHYIRSMETKELHKRILEWAKRFKKEIPEEFTKSSGVEVLELIKERLKIFSEVPELVSYFYKDPEYDEKLLLKFAKERSKAIEILNGFKDSFKDVAWEEAQLDKVSHDLLEKGGYKPKEAFMTLRVAVSGVTATPPIFETLDSLGKEVSLRRIDAALDVIDSR